MDVVNLTQLLKNISKKVIVEACAGLVTLNPSSSRTRHALFTVLLSHPPHVQQSIADRALRVARPRRCLIDSKEPRAKRQKMSHTHQEGPLDNIERFIHNSFMRPPSKAVSETAIASFIDKTGNKALQRGICVSCARITNSSSGTTTFLDDIPYKHHLQPATAHPAHILTDGLLLHHNISDESGRLFLCNECYSRLSADKRPPLSLANNLWVGDQPHELASLTLPERILIAKFFPVAYIFKLFPKTKGAHHWDRTTMNSGLRGNVSTYRLDNDEISKMVEGSLMPPPVAVLSSTIGVTFVGANNLPHKTLPDMFRVRRRRVAAALYWLKQHNPLYYNIEISEERLNMLPINDVPNEILLSTRYSSDIARLNRERDSYVPEHGSDDDDDSEVPNTEHAIHASHDLEDLSDPHWGTASSKSKETSSNPCLVTEPAVIPLQALGVVDANCNDIPDNDILAHALSNTANVTTWLHREEFNIRHGSAFINEYARVDDTSGIRTDGGPSNPNHLLGSFPVLFPYGTGGFETNRPENVPYEVHARWALQYADKRFRKDLHFIFQVFGVIQKRNVCRYTSLQIKKTSFVQQQTSIRRLTPADLLVASKEETRRVPFSNSSVQALRNEIKAIRTNVPGTDESRLSIRGRIWSTVVKHNPPSLWLTINPSDTNDPIVQVLAGKDIDLDRFCATTGPSTTERATTVANDPFAAAEFFHFMIKTILQELLGLEIRRNTHIYRQEGILGLINSYIGTVEAQGRGTLHLHMLLWLHDSPTAAEMRKLLQMADMRQKIEHYISHCISGNIGGLDAPSTKGLKPEKSAGYSRPVDPREPNYEGRRKAKEIKLARAVQYHTCTTASCLKVIQDRLRCKRRAPFPCSARAWIDELGLWGPERYDGFVNNFCPDLLQCVQANHDLKLISNGVETKDITWYITGYAAKSQHASTNISAVLANSLAYHHAKESKSTEIVQANKRMLQSCCNSISRSQEFSAPEVISLLMGWGDRYESHHYVAIFWDVAVVALKKAYPGLRPKALNDRLREHLGIPEEHSDNIQSSELFTQIQFNDGVMQVRDQIRDYMYRGSALEDLNFLDFHLETYKGALLPTKCSGKEGTNQGRTSERILYEPEAGKEGRCRIKRRPGHETLPHFIGTWFCRSDEPGVKEFYCASMLLLLKPWHSLRDLKTDGQSFKQSFDQFMAQADVQTQRIIDNINYFHECSDGAKRKQASNELHIGDDKEHPQTVDTIGGDDENILNFIHHTMDDDIAMARENAQNDAELQFAEKALITAHAAGIFSYSASTEAAILRPTLRLATMQEMKTFDWLAAQLKHIVRSDLSMTSDTPSLVDNATVTAVNLSQDEVRAGVTNALTGIASIPATHPHDPTWLAMLNADQQRAHTIIEEQLRQELSGIKPTQLLMLVMGQGGTGKSLLIRAITETFRKHGEIQRLAKTAPSGVAASLIGGQTLHMFAGIPVTGGKDDGWVEKGSKEVQARRQANIAPIGTLIIDEISMVDKKLFASASEIISKVLSSSGQGNPSLPFGGINVICFGDFHQFPPVVNATGALYCDRPLQDSRHALIGRQIYTQFQWVVILREQKRIRDLEWSELLSRLRIGECNEADIKCLHSLTLTSSTCHVPDFTTEPWASAILVTPRHAVREMWNMAALSKYCTRTNERLYCSTAEDTIRTTGLAIPKYVKRVVVTKKPKQTGKLEERIYLAIGMKAMVVLNIATEADVANGTRGVIEDMILDARERNALPGADGIQNLQYPPALVIFRPDIPCTHTFDGIPNGLIPISPSASSFMLKTPDGKSHSISHRQLAITPAYAFTDYKSQGQTIENVIVDLADPPSNRLSPFSAYVALSRSRGRDTIRILRQFDEALFTRHPSDDLRDEDSRLAWLDYVTKMKYHNRHLEGEG